MAKENGEAAEEAEVATAPETLEEGDMRKGTQKVELGKATQAIEAERIASRQRAHDAKVAKYLAGGEF